MIDGDAFSLAVNELAEPPTIISPGIRCGPGSEDYNPQFVPCKAGSFDFVVPSTASLPVGTELEYVWARYRGEQDTVGTVISTDTVTVTQNAQVFTVVYDYGGGAPLSDTAMSAPADGVPLGTVAAIGAVLAALAHTRRRRMRPRPS